MGSIRVPLIQLNPRSHRLRNVDAQAKVAMSLITSEQDRLIYRFMFISLLNLGAATVCATLIAAWGLATGLRLVGWLPSWGSVVFQTIRPLDWPVPLVGV